MKGLVKVSCYSCGRQVSIPRDVAIEKVVQCSVCLEKLMFEHYDREQEAERQRRLMEINYGELGT